MTTTTEAVSIYRLAPQASAKIVGGLLAGLGGLVVVVTFVFALLKLPVVALVGGALLGLLGIVAVAVWAWRGPVMVRLDETGYQARVRRGHGVRTARWADVKDAVTAEVSGVPCVVLRLRSGQSTTIPVELLAADRDAFVTDVRARLVQRTR